SFAPIPKSDDRFARQNRFGLPSEFPLTSSCSGIVHHLSGLIAYALSPPIYKYIRWDYTACFFVKKQSYITSSKTCFTFITPISFYHLMTRTYDKLLGPIKLNYLKKLTQALTLKYNPIYTLF
uniref:Maturase K n=1 Tax=Panagrolaimus sp. ES5 TaxID=591445 RepID=A0AC34GMI0_9BILA